MDLANNLLQKLSALDFHENDSDVQKAEQISLHLGVSVVKARNMVQKAIKLCHPDKNPGDTEESNSLTSGLNPFLAILSSDTVKAAGKTKTTTRKCSRPPSRAMGRKVKKTVVVRTQRNGNMTTTTTTTTTTFTSSGLNKPDDRRSDHGETRVYCKHCKKPPAKCGLCGDCCDCLLHRKKENGSKYRHAHGSNERDTSRRGMCTHFLRGNCRYGNNCKFSHERTDRKKTVLCRYFLAGNCRRGKSCKFAHGEADLRK